MSDSRPPANRRKSGGKLRNGLDPSVGQKTQFQPGQSGNPSGRPKQKPILETLREVIDSDPEFARKIARHALKEAARSLSWFQEIRNMLDGPLESEQAVEAAKVNFDLNVRFVEDKDALPDTANLVE